MPTRLFRDYTTLPTDLETAAQYVNQMQRDARLCMANRLEVDMGRVNAMPRPLRLEITDLLDVLHGAGLARRYPSGRYEVLGL